MKFGKIMVIAGAMMSVATTVLAEHDWSWNWNDRFAYSYEAERYRSQEFQIDLFASYKRNHDSIDDFFDEPEGGAWGGGIGINYFFTRTVGVATDMSMHDDGAQFIDNAAASLVFRMPIGTSPFAPYIFGGGGRNFDRVEAWEGHVGIGVEFRMNQYTGLFADARYIWPDKAPNSSMIHTGLRFVF